MAQATGLADYILNTLFQDWFKERQRVLEPKWQKNIDAFNAISTGFWKIEEAEGWRSKTFFQVTRVKIISAYSIIIDLLLQGGRIPFKLVPSPMDEVALEDMEDQDRVRIEDAINDMEKRIHQQFKDSNADRQLILNVLAGAIYGETYAKFHMKHIKRGGFRQVNFAPDGLQDEEGQFSRFEEFSDSALSPAWAYISVWDIFRDLEAIGPDAIQEGVGIIHRSFASPFALRERIGQPFWIEKALKEAIADAPGPGAATDNTKTASISPHLRHLATKRRGLQELEFWGRVPTALVEQFEEDGGILTSSSEFDTDGRETEIMCVVSGERLTRFARMEDEARPFRRAVWEEKIDHSEANGVADNMEDIQLVLNGAIRGFEDNKRLAGDVMGIIKEFALGENKEVKFKPGLNLDVTSEVEKISDVWQQIIIEDRGESYLSVISLFREFGDEITQLPKQLQGMVQPGKKPNTAFESNLLQQNSGKYIGGVIKNYDEGLIEPMSNDFYRINMLDKEVTSGKGNFVAEAQGFSSFQNTVVRLQKIMQFLNLVLSHPVLTAKAKIRPMMEDIATALDASADVYLKSPEEEKEDALAQQQAVEQQQAQILKMQEEQAGIEEEGKEADHERDIEIQDEKAEDDLVKQEEKFKDDVILANLKGRRAA